MNDGTYGDAVKRKGVAGPDINILAGYYLVAYLESLGSKDIRLVAVCVLNQRDKRGTGR